MDKKIIIGIVIAAIVILLAGLAVFTFSNNDVQTADVNTTPADNGTDIISQEQGSSGVSGGFLISPDSSAKDTSDDNSADDSGDVLKKQVFTIEENETGQNEGMEPGSYVMYYTENDGPIKIEKVG